tara:strand:+ start:5004 stop:5591 length:588 start_codon:yes stop_codon:yes gene_type:complete
MANTFGGSNTGKAGLNITETDGSPDVFGVTKIVVSNGTLTDDGAGVVSISTGGGGGGGGVTTLSFGSTGFTPNVASSGVITVSGTLALGSGGTGATTASAAATNLGLGTTDDVQFNSIEIDGNLNHDGTQIGFFGTAIAAQQSTTSSTLNPIPFDPAGGSQLDIATAAAIDTNLASLQDAQQLILDLLVTYGLSS